MYSLLKHLKTLEMQCISVARYSSVAKEQWDLASAVCLERKPVLTKDLNELETIYEKIIQKVEFESSHKSDHEIRKIKDLIYTEQLKKGGKELDSDQMVIQTAQEFEDNCEEELKKFKFAPRITEEDTKGDKTSTNRRLSNSLLLTVKKELGKSSPWVLPQGTRQEGETMRQAAERVLRESCGDGIQAKFMGNAPCGFYKYRYPKSAQKAPAVGMKIFFFKAQLLNGNVSKKVCPDYQWLAQDELGILPDDYFQSVRMFLVDEENQA